MILQLESKRSFAGIGHLSLASIADLEQAIGLLEVLHHLGELSGALSQCAQFEACDDTVLAASYTIHLYRNQPCILWHEPLQVAHHPVPGKRLANYQLSRSRELVAVLFGQENLGIILSPFFLLSF